MSDYFEKVQKLDRLINHPNTSAAERQAAIAARARVVAEYEASRRGTVPPRPPNPSTATAPRRPFNVSIPTGLRNSGGAAIQGAFGAINAPANWNRGYAEGYAQANAAWWSPSGEAYRRFSGFVGGAEAVATGFSGSAAAGDFFANLSTAWIPGNNAQSQSRNTPNQPYESDGGPPPFSGGQSSVVYLVSARLFVQRTSGTDTFTGLNKTISGPITSFAIDSDNSTFVRPRLVVNGQNGTSQAVIAEHPSTFNRAFYVRSWYEIISISRQDGQPDTGGDPIGFQTNNPQQATTTPGTNTPFATPPANPWNPFQNIPRAPDGSTLSRPPGNSSPTNADSENSDEGRPGKPWTPPTGLPFPFIPRNANEAVTRGQTNTSTQTQPPPQQTAEPPSCNPRCALPGIQVTNAAKNEILDALKGLAVQSPTIAGLAALAATVQDIADAVGVNAFPISVPASINQCDQRAGRSLNNLAESQLWQVEQLDSVMGQWCNVIDIETPDGTKQVEVKDMSDAISEILGMLAAQAISGGITQNVAVRTLIEAGATKQQSFLAHQYAKGNAEFLGYQGQRQRTEMPMAFAPGNDLLGGLLDHKNIPIQGWKNTDSRDLNAVLQELLQAAAIIRAVYWRRLDPDGDIEGQVADIITRQANFPEGVRPEPDPNDVPVDNWALYLESVENAFGTTPTAPYGRDPSQRPKLINKIPPEGLG